MNNKSSAYGVIMLLLVAAVAWISKGLFPSVFRTILIFVVILGAGLLVLLALVLYFAFKKPEEKKTAENEAKEVLAKGRSHLMELRRLGMQVKNPDIRKKVDQICALIDKIFQTLKEQPKHILPTRKFFHYYLPTMKAIIQKYVLIESSGIPAAEKTAAVLSCLNDIDQAMEKQYANLFSDDLLDLTVEMNVLTAMCKKDGLLDEDGIGESKRT